MIHAGRIGALVVSVAAMVLVTGCNRIKLAYGWADTYVADQITDYLDLTDDQERQMSASVDAFFAWHRRVMLPKIAKEFGALADKVESGTLNEDRFIASFQTIDGLMRTTVAETIPASAALLATQQGEQVEHLARELAEREQELRNEDARPAKKKLAERMKQAQEFFEGFVGDLTDAQQAILRERVIASLQHRSRMWIDNRTFHVAQLLGAMRRHESEGAIAKVLGAWWLRDGPQLTPAHAAAGEAAITDLRDGMWAMIATLSAEQKITLVDRLRGYARDLMQLSHDS